MSDILSISGSAVAAYQRALGTTSNNIANLSTVGYSRQSVDLSAGTPQAIGQIYVGTGVQVTGIKRSYDQFVEGTLRNAYSGLNTQGPLVQYANRIIDVMGSQNVGLTSALDQFFASAQSLSGDPASIDLRGQFLRDAGGVVGRLHELNTQLGAIEADSRGQIDADVGKLNELSKQLAYVNSQLQKNATSTAQPPELMDQRDNLLRDMSKLASIRVSTRINGMVDVGVGNAGGSGLVVDGSASHSIGASFSEEFPGKVDIVLDPYGHPVTIPGMASGSIGGLVSFRQQALGPAFSQLDTLASSFAGGVNQINKQGVDLNGNTGGNLFVVQPLFRVEALTSKTDIQVSAQIADQAKLVAHDLQLRFDATNKQWMATDMVTGTTVAKPMFQLQANTSDIQVSAKVTNQASYARHNLRLEFDAANKRWLATDMATGVTVPGTPNLNTIDVNGLHLDVSRLGQDGETVTLLANTGDNSIDINGIRLDISRSGWDGETVNLYAAQHASASIQLVENDPRKIAAAALFSVNPQPANTSGVSAAVILQPAPVEITAPSRIDTIIANNPSPAAGVAFTATGYKGLSTIPAGYKDVALFLDGVSSADQNLQVFTKDGRQLIGKKLTPEQSATILRRENGFMAGATYSDTYLNQSGAKSYRGLDVFYGLRQAPGNASVPVYDIAHKITGYQSVAKIDGAAIGPLNNAAGATVVGDGALSVNGKALGPLVMPASGKMQATDIASWVNTVSTASGVTATASNTIEIPAAKIIPSRGVIINGQAIGGSGSGVVDTDSLVKAINQSAAGVSASLTAQGSIVLSSNVPGADIRIGPSTNNGVLQNQFNALQLSDGVYRGHISLTCAQEIKIAVTPSGGAADLARMGLRTGAYVDGVASEDLVVFATGTGPASVAGSYKIAPFDAIASARKEQLKIQFTSPTTYTITDLATNAEMANRTYDPAAGIQIGVRLVQLSGTPATGDQYVLDGNQNGVGNNQNIVRIVDLKDAAVTPDGKTIGVAYNDLVSTIGNVASQATVAQQAMQAVTQQAEKTRDTASGVNLDQEAADLVRFQQAYQAAAKTMQVAAQLFDYIAQIR